MPNDNPYVTYAAGQQASEAVAWTPPQAVAQAAARAATPTFTQQNKLTLTVLAVVVAYVLIASATGIVFLGIAPVMMSIRAVKRKEPLCVLAVVAAGAAVALALSGFRI